MYSLCVIENCDACYMFCSCACWDIWLSNDRVADNSRIVSTSKLQRIFALQSSLKIWDSHKSDVRPHCTLDTAVLVDGSSYACHLLRVVTLLECWVSPSEVEFQVPLLGDNESKQLIESWNVVPFEAEFPLAA